MLRKIALFSAAFGALSAGCATHPGIKSDAEEMTHYQFMVPTTNPGSAPTVFHDGRRTYFLTSPGKSMEWVRNCEDSKKAAVGRDYPYWTVNRIGACWRVRTGGNEYEFRDRKRLKTQTSTPKRDSMSRSSCLSDRELLVRVSRSRQKVERLAKIVGELERGREICTASKSEPDIDKKSVFVVPFPVNSLDLDAGGHAAVASIARVSRGAKRIVLTGHAGGGRHHKPNEWMARVRSRNVRKALIEAGVSSSVIRVVKLDPPPSGVWVQVEIYR